MENLNLLIKAFDKITSAYKKDNIFLSVIRLNNGVYIANLNINEIHTNSIDIHDFSNIDNYKLNKCLKEFLLNEYGFFWNTINNDFYKQGLYRSDPNFSNCMIEYFDKLENSCTTDKLRAIGKFSCLEELIIKMDLMGI